MSKIPSIHTPKPKTTYSSISDGMYPARLVRFVGLGVQPQPEFKDKVTGVVQKKSPAFKVALTFELYDPETLEPLDVTGTTPEGETVLRPSCVFQDYFLFPGGERGNVFDMCNAIQAGTTRVPDDLDWFLQRLGAPLQLNVGTYPKKDGTRGSKVTGVSGLAPFVIKQMAPARTDLVGFDPYVDDGSTDLAYSKIYNFQRTILSEALDSAHIPLAGTEAKKFDEEAPTQAPTHAYEQPAQQAHQSATQSYSEPTSGDDYDFSDDIPF